MRGLVGTITLLIGASSWAAPPAKIAPDLKNVDSMSNVNVIVQWNSAPDEGKQRKVAALGGVLNSVHALINADAYTLPASALSQLSSDDDVVYISPDRPLNAKLDLTAAAVNASYAWNLSNPAVGTGVGIALIDSGIDASDANLSALSLPASTLLSALSVLPSRVIYSQDFVGKNGQDQYGHGQHIAGIIASNGGGSNWTNCLNCTRKFQGIAPNANLINLRVLDANGQGTDSEVISAIEQAIALKSKYNIRVINLSLGRPVYESYTLDPLCQAVEQAWQAGIAVVVAAGNSGRDNTYGEQGYGTVTSPGNDPYVITVGAMKTMGTPGRSDDLIASYSSKGPTQVDHIVKPDIVAPGNLIVSLYAKGGTLEHQYAHTNDVAQSYYMDTDSAQGKVASTEFFTLSGTSMAAGVVSGAIADILSVNANLTPDQVKSLLMLTAYKSFPASSSVTDSTGTYVDYYDIFTIGAGYLDLKAAIQGIQNVPAPGVPALSPTAYYDSSTGDVTLSFAPNGVFTVSTMASNQAIWSSQSVWSASVVNGNRCVWSSQSIWGASTTASSSQSIWGARSIWSARSVWSASGSTAESWDNAGEP